jgi:Flp pilus assembly protein TadD
MAKSKRGQNGAVSAVAASIDPSARLRDEQVAIAWAHYDTGDSDTANKLFRAVLEGDIDHPGALNGMGVLARDMERFDVGIELLRRAIKREKRNAQFHNNLGTILERAERFDEALSEYKRAAKLSPKNPLVQNNIGSVLAKMNRRAEAMIAFRKAIEYGATHPETLVNYATIVSDFGDYAAAEPFFRRAFEQAPDHPSSHFNWGAHMLRQGLWEEAWQHYEWRFRASGSGIVPRHFPQPLWNGSLLGDARLILWGEQGIGDEIRFAGMFPDALDQGGQVTIECEPRLVTLFQRSFPSARIVAALYGPAEDGQEAFEVMCPAGTLGRLFRPTTDAFPDTKGYLSADPERVKDFSERLRAAGPGPYVGVCWRSGLRGAFRTEYYTEIESLEPVFREGGVTFVNLQYDARQEEIDLARARYGIELVQWEDVDLMQDLEAAAALTACMDLVVSAPTSVSCMSGALGIPTTEFRAFPVPEAYPIEDGDPWFPSVRFVDKRGSEKWGKVFRTIASEVRALATGA